MLPACRALRFKSALLLVVASGSVGLAAEEETAKAGLQSARRDYETLKAADARSLEQKAGPKAELPRLEAAPASAGDLLPQRAKKRNDASRADPHQREKSSNWLLEAMRDETETPTTSAEKSLESTLEPGRKIEKGDLVETALALEKQQAAQRKSSDERRERIERNRDASGLNPLDSFMASWMSSKDLELLGVMSGGGTSLQAKGNDAGLPSSLAAPNSAGISTTFNVSPPNMDSGRSSALTSFAPERQNPYLENLSSFAPVESGTSPSVLSFTPAVSELSAPAPSSTEATSTSARLESPSERFRAQDDGKYFKQLKRF